METSIFNELGVQMPPQLVAKSTSETAMSPLPSTSKQMQRSASDLCWISDQINIIQTEVDSCIANVMSTQ